MRHQAKRPTVLRLWILLALVTPTGAAELFGPATISIAAPSRPVDLTIADFNGDGELDLAVVGRDGPCFLRPPCGAGVP